MRIGKENIEEVIFDFHEGNLSDEGKAELMDFLHKHPAYEKEFVLWAKTYHTDKPLLDYGNDDRFLKKKYASPMKWAALAVAGGIMALMIFWPKEEEEKLPLLEELKTVVAVDSVGKASEEAKLTKQNPPIARSTHVAKTEMVTLQKEDSVIAAPLPQVVLEKPDTVLEVKELPQKEPVIEKKKPIRSDSSTVHKKPKRKRKLNLTPSDDILPFNSDF